MEEKGRNNHTNDRGEAVSPTYLTWVGLARYSSCSKRWLQSHVPHSLRFRVGGKVLIRVREFDVWIEQHRDLSVDRIVEELF